MRKAEREGAQHLGPAPAAGCKHGGQQCVHEVAYIWWKKSYLITFLAFEFYIWMLRDEQTKARWS